MNSAGIVVDESARRNRTCLKIQRLTHCIIKAASLGRCRIGTVSHNGYAYDKFDCQMKRNFRNSCLSTLERRSAALALGRYPALAQNMSPRTAGVAFLLARQAVSSTVLLQDIYIHLWNIGGLYPPLLK